MNTNIAAAAAAERLVQNISGVIVNPLIVLMFSVALLVFLWGVREYIAGADNPEVRSKGAQHILWGIVGMGIMVMSFSLVRIVLGTFGLGQDSKTQSDINKVLKR